MEIQTLKLFITDDHLAPLVEQALVGEGVENLVVRLTPEGVALHGQYSTGFGFRVPFETLWEVTPNGPCLSIRLANMKVAGMPSNILRRLLLSMIADSLERYSGIGLREETIVVDVPGIFRPRGLELHIEFTTVRLSIGAVVIEAG